MCRYNWLFSEKLKRILWISNHIGLFIGRVQKSSEKFGKSSEISENVLFQTFQKLRKNDVQLELWKSQKTHSDSKTDSKVQLKVRNAGP